MRFFESRSLPLSLLISTAVLAAGLVLYAAFVSPFRVLPAALLTVVGLYGVAAAVSTYTIDRLRSTTRRWWFVAVVAFLPYGFATAPATGEAESLGAAISGTVAATALEVTAGTLVLAAVAITVVYASARYGVHPGRPTPEERILNEERSDSR